MMFADCVNLQTLDLRQTNFSNATYVYGLAYNCRNLVSLYYNNCIDFSNALSAQTVFREAGKCNFVRQIGTVNTGNSLYLKINGQKCQTLIELAATGLVGYTPTQYGNLSTVNIQYSDNASDPQTTILFDIQLMMCWQRILTSYRMWKTGGGTNGPTFINSVNLRQAFLFCNYLSSPVTNVGIFPNLATNIRLDRTFYGCYSLTGNALTAFPITATSTVNLRADPYQPISTFWNCTRLTDYSLIQSNWKVYQTW
jgi:hypothetical protein